MFYVFTGFHPSIQVSPSSIAAGQNTTLFLAKPNEKLSDLPRHPIDVEPPEVCIECNKDNGDDDPPLECDKVCSFPLSYHIPLVLSLANVKPWSPYGEMAICYQV